MSARHPPEILLEFLSGSVAAREPPPAWELARKDIVREIGRDHTPQTDGSQQQERVIVPFRAQRAKKPRSGVKIW